MTAQPGRLGPWRPWAGERPGLSRALLAWLPIVLAVEACTIPRWPVQASVTSDFGVRFRGIVPGVHRGTDLAVPVGTPVQSMAGGRVRFAGIMSGFGNVVWVDHGGAVLSVYAHLSRIDVRTGETVAGGETLGLSGMTGNAEAPHLHFEVWRWGREVDPVPLLGGFPSSG